MSMQPSERQDRVVAFLREHMAKGGRITGLTRNEIAEAIGVPAEDLIPSLRGLEKRKTILSRKTKGGVRAPLRYHLNPALNTPES